MIGFPGRSQLCGIVDKHGDLTLYLSTVNRKDQIQKIVEDEPLDEKKRQFVEHYLTCASAADAAEQSGFSRSYGSTLLKQPLVRAAIAKCIEGDELVMQREERLRVLTAYARGHVYGADHRARLDALKTLSKISGDFDDGVRVQIANINQNNGPTLDLTKLSVEELENLAKIVDVATPEK